MASHAISRPLLKSSTASLFLRLPPSIRSFHASTPRRSLEPLLTSTHAILETIHSTTGLSWAYTLPLFALSIRMTILLPLSIYSRRSLQKQAELAPLLFAWSHNIRQSSFKKNANLGPTVVATQFKAGYKRKQKELFKRWGCQSWKSYFPMAQLPVWLVAVETVRRMCGTNQGLLGLIFSSKPDPTTVPEIGTNTALTSEVGTVTALSTSSPIGIEPTFATEGALWFPNLLLPDPELYLPFMLGGLMMVNIAPWKVNSSTAVWPRRLTRGAGVVALFVPFLVMKMPTAMLIYWVGSSGCALLQHVILDRLMPVKPKVTPCTPKDRKPM